MRTSTLFVSFFRFLKRCCREATFSNGPGHLVVAGDAVRGDELEAIFRPQGATLICRLVPIEEPDLEAFGFPEFERDGPPAVAGFGRIARQRIVERVEKLLADRRHMTGSNRRDDVNRPLIADERDARPLKIRARCRSALAGFAKL